MLALMDVRTYLPFLGCDNGAVPIGDVCIKESCLVTTGAPVMTTIGPTIAPGQTTLTGQTKSSGSTRKASESPMSLMTDGPCADTSAQCRVWMQNGFCTSAFYPEMVKRTTCGVSCNLCSTISITLPTTTKSCADKNANECRVWLGNGFCSSNFYPEQVRRDYCPKSCNFC
ncbi:unnamed protein product, partial [Mesorhabditis belari]|uniref:ShKT domain-containing protein n=1 Tax=Mesorhabditis belari TaxID=2138241 RepID=A0AAF3F4G4_9BILA